MTTSPPPPCPLWLSWLSENNFSHDSQAATYHQASGSRMVSLIPNMGHGHAAAWNRPESYAFADGIVNGNGIWCEQQSINSNQNTVEAVFITDRPLDHATLIYTTDSGWTGDFEWIEIAADQLIESAPDTWTITASLPLDATAWLINVTASNEVGDELVVSSDYQERIQVVLEPADLLNIGHPLSVDRSTSYVQLSFTAPSYIEIVDVSVHSESHPGAFCSSMELPVTLKQVSPTQHTIELTFDNVTAGLQDGEIATAVLNIAWGMLDGSMGQIEIPIQLVARSAFNILYTEDALWSSKVVYSADRVTIRNQATVELDVTQSVADLTVENGVLTIEDGNQLTVGDQLEVKADGAIHLTQGTLNTEDHLIKVDGVVQIDGGSFGANMSGVSRDIRGNGLIEIHHGHINFSNGVPTNVLAVDTNMSIYGGTVTLSGQVYVGYTKPTTFEIIGDEASITMVRLNTSGAINKGTLRFVLDETGVSKINVLGWMNLGSVKLVVDGSRYTGGPTQMVLIDSNNLVGLIAEANITVQGFAEHGLNAYIVQDTTNPKDWVQLVIE